MLTGELTYLFQFCLKLTKLVDLVSLLIENHFGWTNYLQICHVLLSDMVFDATISSAVDLSWDSMRSVDADTTGSTDTTGTSGTDTTGTSGTSGTGTTGTDTTGTGTNITGSAEVNENRLA
jgi:hypothetical protein